MGVISGVGGVVEGAAAIEQWSIDVTNETKEAVASNTKGGTNRIAGNTDWNGAYNALGHTPASLPGAALSFKGSLDGAKGVDGTAIVSVCRITSDLSAAEILKHVVEFQGNGTLNRGANVVTDVTVPDPLSSIPTKLSLDAVDEANFRNWELVLESENPEYADVENAGEMRRAAGNKDANLTYTRNFDDFADIPDVGAVIEVRLYVTATLFWHVKWAIVDSVGNIEINLASPSIVSVTVNASMKGFKTIADVPTEGFIKSPAGVAWWPV